MADKQTKHHGVAVDRDLHEKYTMATQAAGFSSASDCTRRLMDAFSKGKIDPELLWRR